MLSLEMKAVAPRCRGGNLRAASAGPWVLPRRREPRAAQSALAHRWHLLTFRLQSITASRWVLSPSPQSVHAARPGLCPCISAPKSQRHPTQQRVPDTEERIAWFPEGYFCWPLAGKWHCESKIAADVRATVGSVPAEAPPGGNTEPICSSTKCSSGDSVHFQGFCSSVLHIS